MKVLLKPGETLDVGFYEDDGDFPGGWNVGDGSFSVEYSVDYAIRVSAELSDSTGREGVIYEEIPGQPGPKEAAFYEAIEAAPRALDISGQPVSPEMQKALEDAAAANAERPVPAIWRQTKADKEAGDSIVARNLRDKFKPHLNGWTDDTALADQFEIFRTSSEYLERGEDAFPAWLEPVTPEPGEHAVVVQAWEDLQSGEER